MCDDKSATLLLIYQKCDLVPLLRSRRTEVSPNNNDNNNNNRGHLSFCDSSKVGLCSTFDLFIKNIAFSRKYETSYIKIVNIYVF